MKILETSRAEPAGSLKTMPKTLVHIDTVIVGGGIAGLWLLNVLLARGYSSVLLEAGSLGGTQTLASQGIIHGGIKYALAGAPTQASEAMRGAPRRWRDCLEGSGEVDLSELTPVAEHCCLFTPSGALGGLTAWFGSKRLRGRVDRLQRGDYPAALQSAAFRGSVYRLEDFVLDTSALVRHLASLASRNIYRHTLEPGTCAPGAVVRIEIAREILVASRLILAAGAGNEALLRGLGISGIPMQRRPLHQVLVRRAGLPPLFGHCLGGSARAEPRLTITSHPDRLLDGGSGHLWYIGGRLATDGAERDTRAQQCRAGRELAACFPWMDWRGAVLETRRIDRAEPARHAGRRPDQCFVAESGACIVCWPTKLTLVPDLADRVLELLPPPQHPPPARLGLPAAPVGSTPWGA